MDAARMFVGIFLAFVLVIVLVPYWVIFKKAGFSPWISLLMLVPVVNVVVLYVVAFSPWKLAPSAPTPGASVIHPISG